MIVKYNNSNLLLRINSSNFSINNKVFGIFNGHIKMKTKVHRIEIDKIYEYATSAIESALNAQYAIDAKNHSTVEKKTNRTFKLSDQYSFVSDV